MDIAKDLAIQSYCFRGFKDNVKVAEMVKECGATSIEVCGVHADFNDESTFDGVIKTYADAGVAIVSIGCENISDDEAAARKRFEFCKASGARYMSVGFSPATVPAAYRVAEELCDEYGVKLGIHNHGGRDWLGNSTMLRHTFGQTNDSIGLCLDTAWALDSREDPVKMADEFAARLYGLHFKDFVFDKARTPEDVVIGTGNLDLPGLMASLKSGGFDGYAVIEYEGDVDNPVPALTECVDIVKKAVV